MFGNCYPPSPFCLDVRCIAQHAGNRGHDCTEGRSKYLQRPTVLMYRQPQGSSDPIFDISCEHLTMKS
jgi:hypothetical protein